MIIQPIDEANSLSCVKGDKIISKFPAFSKNGVVTYRYFNVPLRHQKQEIIGDFKDSIKIQGNEAVVQQGKSFYFKSAGIGSSSGGHLPNILTPFVVYKTDKHIIITLSQQQFGLQKIIYGIVATVVSIFCLFFLLLSFILSIAFLLWLIFFAPLVIYFYLLFLKKSYIWVGSLDSIYNVNQAEQTISLKGRFNTGIPSFLTKDIDAEFYVGENINKSKRGD